MTYSVSFEYREATSNVVVWDDNRTATLNTVYSKFRRRGAGRKVVEKAIEYVDYLHLDLFLEVMPFGDEPQMEATDLKAFYMSLGFENRGGNIMMRSRNYTQNLISPECPE